MLVYDSYAPTRRTVYSLNFLLTLVVATTTYFTTPLLIARGVSEEYVGLIFAIGAIANLSLLFFAPRLFSKLGNYKASIALLLSGAIGLALLAFFTQIFVVIGLVIAFSSITYATTFLLDIILEDSMPSEGATGSTRGFFITMANAAWFIGPAFGGMLIALGEFELLFIVAAALSVPGIFIARKHLRTVTHHIYSTPHLHLIQKILLHDKDMRGVFAAQFLLRTFFTIMVIYTPLYLVEHIGLSYSSFGAILSMAMIAYLALEIPIGLLADKKLGEKELMITGFVILAVATALLSFGAGTSVLLWGGILLCTRIGAALVDITTESYFFKHVGGEHADMVSAFRMLGPLGYIVGPIFGSILIFFFPLQYLFVVFGVVLLLGIPFALSFKDTR